MNGLPCGCLRMNVLRAGRVAGTRGSAYDPVVVHPDRRWNVKVPEITAVFWVVKVLTTAMGESTSDFLVHRFGAPVAIPVAGVLLLVALVLQFAARRYEAWTYWLAVAMVAVFGTMAADSLHAGLGVPYAVSTAFFAGALAVVFAVWYAVERTLSIHSIDTPRREVFYWATVMATFALGTAAGDLTATTLGLGYLASGLLFTALIAVPAVARRWLGLGEVAAFWAAYVLTRPLGASFADWLAVPRWRGGLDLGYGTVSLALTVTIVGLVAWLTITRGDEPASGPGPGPGVDGRGAPAG